jgi:hypothetical protein
MHLLLLVSRCLGYLAYPTAKELQPTVLAHSDSHSSSVTVFEGSRTTRLDAARAVSFSSTRSRCPRSHRREQEDCAVVVAVWIMNNNKRGVVTLDNIVVLLTPILDNIVGVILRNRMIVCCCRCGVSLRTGPLFDRMLFVMWNGSSSSFFRINHSPPTTSCLWGLYNLKGLR